MNYLINVEYIYYNCKRSIESFIVHAYNSEEAHDDGYKMATNFLNTDSSDKNYKKIRACWRYGNWPESAMITNIIQLDKIT